MATGPNRLYAFSSSHHAFFIVSCFLSSLHTQRNLLDTPDHHHHGLVAARSLAFVFIAFAVV